MLNDPVYDKHDIVKQPLPPVLARAPFCFFGPTSNKALPDLSSLYALADLSVSANRLNGVGAMGALPASLTKLVLRDNNLGGVPLALLGGVPALQVFF